MFLSLLQNRRSIRKFTDLAVEPEKIDMLVEAVLRSPSGKSIDPWEFVVVDDRDMLVRLSSAKTHGAGFLKHAALGIVICADKEKSDTHVEDASIATIFAHLAAASLGLGSCWIQIRNRTNAEGQSSERIVAEELGIPANYSVQAIMAVGYPDETKAGHTRQDLHFQKVFKGRFGRKMY